MLQPQAFHYFAEVVRTGSLRKASEKFFVAPSAISRQIANLEHELGSTLFERSSRGMVLTAAGRVLLDYVLDNDRRVEGIRSQIHDLTQLRRGTVRLAVVEAVVSDFLPTLITRFRALFPGIGFEVDVCGTHDIADRIAGNMAEIGLAFNVLSRDDLLLRGRLAQPLQVICRPAHRLAKRRSVTLADLCNEQVILPNEAFGIRYLVDRAAARAGVSLSVCCVANSLQLLKTMVASSDLLTFMPPLTFTKEAASKQLRAISLSDKTCERASLDIVTAREHQLSAAAQAFLKPLLEACAQP